MNIRLRDLLVGNAQTRSPRTNHCTCSFYRFFHHIAQRTGTCYLAFTRHCCDFDRKQIAADFRPSKTCDLADLIALVHDTEVVATDTEEVVKIVGVGDHLSFGLLQKDVTDRFTADLIDLAL